MDHHRRHHREDQAEAYRNLIIIGIGQGFEINLNWHLTGQLGASCKFIMPRLLHASTNTLEMHMRLGKKLYVRGSMGPNALRVFNGCCV